MSADFQKEMCRVRVKYKGQEQTIFVECAQDGNGRVLSIPMDIFPDVKSRPEITTLLRKMRRDEIERAKHPEWQFECIPLVDLDGLYLHGDI